MIQILLAAPGSGSGKTVVTCALLRTLQKKGYSPCAFKCGPDYIDPAFHRSILGVDGCNLDLFLAKEEQVRELYDFYREGHDACVIEGVMGYYDGLGGSSLTASTCHVADTLHLPVILVVTPKGQSLTLAAAVEGILRFHQPNHIVGILLNQCGDSLARQLSPLLEQVIGVPVLGALPKMPEAQISSRHLGLFQAEEIRDLSDRIECLAERFERSVDVDRLLQLCDLCDTPFPSTFKENAPEIGMIPRSTFSAKIPPPKTVIAVARDAAFTFSYRENLDVLRQEGAELRFFSPLRDEELPPSVGGLYLPGGYPERYARELSQNKRLLSQIKAAIASGLPVVAECGGYLYLQQSLEGMDGVSYPMVGFFSGHGKREPHLVRFGYWNMKAKEDSMLFSAGEQVPVHSFHYWDVTDSGEAFSLSKPDLGQKQDQVKKDASEGVKRTVQEGEAGEAIYASFLHLYFPGKRELARRFVEKAEEFCPS